jgi:biopolymer transport protein ExbD
VTTPSTRVQRSIARRGLETKHRPKGRVRAEINVTPLVDVVLVLLIIFMVITPMIVRGASVELPITSHHDRKNDDNKDLIVSINSSGDVYVNADKIAIDKLTTSIQEERRRHPDKGIFLKADHRIRYGTARVAMEAIHKAGVEDVQIGTDEQKTPAANVGNAGNVGRPR